MLSRKRGSVPMSSLHLIQVCEVQRMRYACVVCATKLMHVAYVPSKVS